MSRKFVIAALVAAGLLSMYTVGRAAVTDQHAVVSGVVVAEGLVQQGTAVQKGDVLVKVRSLAGGSIAAARATTAGRVSLVLVKAGDKIAPQQVVAKISE